MPRLSLLHFGDAVPPENRIAPVLRLPGALTRHHRTRSLISVPAAAEKLKVSDRRVRVLCVQGRIPGAVKIGRDWLLPDKPVVIAADRRRPGKITMKD